MHALVRGLGFLVLWLALMPSVKPVNLAVGLVATIAATWASLRLLPPATGRVPRRRAAAAACRASCGNRWWPASMSRAAPSVRACRCNPGFVDYPVGLPRGSARNAFELISSLLPGSVPTGETRPRSTTTAWTATSRWSNRLAAEERACRRPWSRERRMDEFLLGRRPSCW